MFLIKGLKDRFKTIPVKIKKKKKTMEQRVKKNKW